MQEKDQRKKKPGKISNPALLLNPYAIKSCSSFMRRKWLGGENSFIAAAAQEPPSSADLSGVLMEIHALGLINQTTGTSESHREGVTGTAMISPARLSLSLWETDRRRARGKYKKQGAEKNEFLRRSGGGQPLVGLVLVALRLDLSAAQGEEHSRTSALPLQPGSNCGEEIEIYRVGQIGRAHV